MYDELAERLRSFADFTKHNEFLRRALNDAADAIEELLSERDEVNADSWKRAFEVERDDHRWIPVMECLPSAHELVFVYNPGYLMSTGFVYEDGRWRVRSVDYPETPTHWMPLPEPPTEIGGVNIAGQ